MRVLPFDLVLMFKILLIQTLSNLSDERMAYLINACFSFTCFLKSEAVRPGAGCQNGLVVSRASGHSSYIWQTV